MENIAQATISETKVPQINGHSHSEMNEPIEKKPKSKSIRILVEKLDGGFISDCEGKRKIYSEVEDITDSIGVPKLLNGLIHGEYHVNIDLIPHDEYENYIDAIELAKKEKELEGLTLDEAKEKGIVTSEKYNPNKNVEEETKEIKIDRSNCYSTARLKAIDWKGFDEQMPMPIVEKAEIAGINKTTFYATWASCIKGKAHFQRIETKIGLTILAKYFEKNLDVRTSSKEQNEMLKETMISKLRDLELLCSKQKFVKSGDVQKMIIEMRKPLL